eukprot:TRINITY_DN94503_c0_g1_i1.p1 TRINITY_DN94503_c0_g1~~TRINITY_DN94503_c0_g1_i1.p1  ORF type:complete len:825 (-),score=96.33 TRINITY_DN94503_c0_g1_i1:3-2477(-)
MTEFANNNAQQKVRLQQLRSLLSSSKLQERISAAWVLQKIGLVVGSQETELAIETCLYSGSSGVIHLDLPPNLPLPRIVPRNVLDSVARQFDRPSGAEKWFDAFVSSEAAEHLLLDAFWWLFLNNFGLKLAQPFRSARTVDGEQLETTLRVLFDTLVQSPSTLPLTDTGNVIRDPVVGAEDLRAAFAALGIGAKRKEIDDICLHFSTAMTRSEVPNDFPTELGIRWPAFRAVLTARRMAGFTVREVEQELAKHFSRLSRTVAELLLKLPLKVKDRMGTALGDFIHRVAFRTFWNCFQASRPKFDPAFRTLVRRTIMYWLTGVHLCGSRVSEGVQPDDTDEHVTKPSRRHRTLRKPGTAGKRPPSASSASSTRTSDVFNDLSASNINSTMGKVSNDVRSPVREQAVRDMRWKQFRSLMAEVSNAPTAQHASPAPSPVKLNFGAAQTWEEPQPLYERRRSSAAMSIDFPGNASEDGSETAATRSCSAAGGGLHAARHTKTDPWDPSMPPGLSVEGLDYEFKKMQKSSKLKFQQLKRQLKREDEAPGAVPRASSGLMRQDNWYESGARNRKSQAHLQTVKWSTTAFSPCVEQFLRDCDLSTALPTKGEPFSVAVLPSEETEPNVSYVALAQPIVARAKAELVEFNVACRRETDLRNENIREYFKQRNALESQKALELHGMHASEHTKLLETKQHVHDIIEKARKLSKEPLLDENRIIRDYEVLLGEITNALNVRSLTFHMRNDLLELAWEMQPKLDKLIKLHQWESRKLVPHEHEYRVETEYERIMAAEGRVPEPRPAEGATLGDVLDNVDDMEDVVGIEDLDDWHS